MPTDYSPLDALPAPQGGDIVRVGAFTDLRAAIDGKLVLTCTSATRPTGTARFTGRLIFETDTKIWRTWDGTCWAWTSGAQEIRTLDLPQVTGTVSAYATFPVVAGGSVAAQTIDPDAAFAVNTTAGSQGLTIRDPGVYEAAVILTCPNLNDAKALAVLFHGSDVIGYAGGIFGPSGATMVASRPFVAAGGQTVIPKVWTYTGNALTPAYAGTLTVRKIGPK